MKKPYFPMFVDLSGRQVTVVGGGFADRRRCFISARILK